MKLKFESDPFNNAFSKSAKTPIQRKGRFTVNEFCNRSKKLSENLNNETRQNDVKLQRK